MQGAQRTPLNDSVLHLLHRAGQVADDLFAKEISDSSLTPRQYAVLAVLAKKQTASQTDIVNATGIDRSTLADIVRRMLKKGLLQRRRTKNNARAYAVKLTEEGWRVLRSAEPMVRRVDDRILAILPGKQREQFLADLMTIVEALSTPTIPGSRRG